ncbi:MAG TPA: NnrS family protein [Burkholderiales bacterium]
MIPLSEPRPELAAPKGFALFALGFRPFYLLAGLLAALAVPLWALQYAGWLPHPNVLWHAHEMIFGYAFAVIAGFLLTAVRAWTGLPTPTGVPLALIAALWIAARITALYSLDLAALVDVAFALAVAAGIGRPLIASGNRRNWFFILLVAGLGAASVAFIAWPSIAFNVGLDLILFVMAVVGGRVIPSFTNNAVTGAGAQRVGWLDKASLGAVLLLLAMDAAGLDHLAALAAMVAASLHGARLLLWAPGKTRGRPILWILHLSYAWLVLHLALRALAGFELVPANLATHALTVGAIGGLTLGMMTRTSRGHTGRPLTVGPVETLAYALVHVAAAVRALLPLLLPGAYVALVGASAALWGAAFALFFVVYLPILTRPRIDGKPG